MNEKKVAQAEIKIAKAEKKLAMVEVSRGGAGQVDAAQGILFPGVGGVVTLAEKPAASRPSIGEVRAAAGVDIFATQDARTLKAQVNPNDFFEKEKNRTMIEQVRAMNEADPHLWGMMQTRKLAILSFERQIMGEGIEVDFVRAVFARLKNFDQALMQLLDAIACGFSLGEILWNYMDKPGDVLNGKVVIDDLLPRCQDKFIFDGEWALRLQHGSGDGLLMPDKKFIVFTYSGEFGNRYGSALYQKIYWYWYVKKNMTKFRAIFCEKHGAPTVIGKIPKGNTDTASEEKLFNFISNLKNQNALSLPDGFDVKLLEAQRTGSSEAFDSFITWLTNGMAIAVLGQAGTIESGDNGSNARVTGLDKVRQDILRADISFLESVINDYLIKWLVDYNFANVKEYPKWRIVYEQKPDIKMLAEVVNILVQSGDDQIPLSWIHQKVGIPEVVPGEKTFVRQATPAPFGPTFAEIQFKRDQEIFQREIKK